LLVREAGYVQCQDISSDVVGDVAVTLVDPAEVVEISSLAEVAGLITIFEKAGRGSGEVYDAIVDSEIGCNDASMLFRCGMGGSAHGSGDRGEGRCKPGYLSKDDADSR
jgi:hypothetical protein